MTFLPIVERELRVASRLPKTYRDRWRNAAVMLGLFLFIYATQSRYATPAQIGQSLFQVFSTVMFIRSLCYCFVTADSLSSEKREGTIGLLFLTDLRGYDIVFGKLAVTSFNAAYHLLATFPLLSLPLLMGGVTGADFWRMQLVIANALFFSLSAGMFVSSMSWHARKTLVGTGLIVTVLSVGIPILETAILQHWRLPDTPVISRYVSPTFCFVENLNRRGGLAGYWVSQASVHSLGWLFLIFASFLIQRRWQEKPLTTRGARWAERLKMWSLGDAEKRKGYRTQMFAIAGGPVCWLDDRYRLQKTFLWGVLLVFVTVWMACYNLDPIGWLKEPTVIFSALCLHYGLLIWIAFQAAHRFIEDRRSGAFELLLATPLSAKEIIAGRMRALRRQFAWPIAAVLAFDVCMAAGAYYMSEGRWLRSPWSFWGYDFALFWFTLWFGAMILLLVNTWAVVWMGLWLGMKARTIGAATLVTVVRVLLCHWIAFIVTVLVLAPVWFRVPRRGLSPGYCYLVTWLGWGLVFSLIYGLTTRRNLFRDFRTLAVRRFDAPAESWLSRWKRNSKPPAQPVPSTVA